MVSFGEAADDDAGEMHGNPLSIMEKAWERFFMRDESGVN